MPIVKIPFIGQNVAVWQITETVNELMEEIPEDILPHDFVHIRRTREWLAGRSAAKYLALRVGLVYQGIQSKNGLAPQFKNVNAYVSIAHCYPYAVAQVDMSAPVGIDIERLKSKLVDVSKRILSDDEIADAGENLKKCGVYWCAKETLYKIYGQRGISWHSQLRINPFHLSLPHGKLYAFITQGMNSWCYQLCYVVFDDFVMVFLLK